MQHVHYYSGSHVGLKSYMAGTRDQARVGPCDSRTDVHVKRAPGGPNGFRDSYAGCQASGLTDYSLS